LKVVGRLVRRTIGGRELGMEGKAVVVVWGDTVGNSNIC
jgi:hypothetical protein